MAAVAAALADCRRRVVRLSDRAAERFGGRRLSRMTAADVRVPHARLIVVLAGLVACGAILWLSRTYTFYFDEWTFISTAPTWTFTSFFEPHNEHPSMLFRLVFWVLLNTVGTLSYLPYMTLLMHPNHAFTQRLVQLH